MKTLHAEYPASLQACFVVIALVMVLATGCVSVQPEPTPVPTPRHFMIVPVNEQPFFNDPIPSWKFSRDILPVNENTSVEKYIDPELFESSSFDTTCDFSDTDQPAIKGDIDSGRRVYYIPGDASYLEIAIDELEGERWFCAEQTALDAGWRRPPV